MASESAANPAGAAAASPAANGGGTNQAPSRPVSTGASGVSGLAATPPMPATNAAPLAASSGSSAAAGGMTGSPRAGSTAAASGSISAAGSAGSAGAAGPQVAAGFPAVSDLGGDGPYKAMTEMSTGPNGGYTIYRPTQLAPDGAKNPVVAWMSGGGSTPDQYELLPHLASHGFVVIASNTSPSLGDEVKLGQELIAALEWMLAENAASGSAYFEKIDPSKLASMGYSMGALATTTIAGDPRLTTTVHISGGNMTTERVKMLHAPAAFVCGASGTDIAGANCASDFEAAPAPVFYAVFNGGDHLGVRTQPYAGRIQILVTAWLRWRLMSDASLTSMFLGDQCTFCKDPNWTVKQKGLQ